MMTLILIVSFVLIALVVMVRIDMHRYKYRTPPQEEQASKPDDTADSAAPQNQQPK